MGAESKEAKDEVSVQICLTLRWNVPALPMMLSRWTPFNTTVAVPRSITVG
jgi:hypothetical protein